jgi:hypothetical protein
VGAKTFGGLNRRLKEKAAESRWFATTGQAPFGRATAASWKIKSVDFQIRAFLQAAETFRQPLIHAAANFASFL